MKRFKALALATLIAVSALFVARPEAVLAAGETTVTIYHTNDMHGRFVGGSGVMGIDIIAAIKAGTPNALLVDAGDTFHGLPFVTMNKGLDAVTLMNLAGYDVFAPGNHDFNYGYERLLELRDEAEFEFVSANIIMDRSHLFTQSVIIEVDGVNIGFFGLTSDETYYKTNPLNIIGLTFGTDPLFAKAAVHNLTEAGADLIVALTHLGTDESSEFTSIALAEFVPGIDLIIDGHSHSLYENGLVVGNTLIASAGQYEGYLGVVTVSFDGDNNVTAIEASVISAADAIEAYEPHEEVVALIEEIRAAQGLVLDVAITEFAYSLSSARDPGVRTQEMPLGNLVADAMLFGSGADIALANGGGLRADINEGTVTIGDVIAVLPFGNYGVTKYITAADLKVLLENGVAGAPAAVGKFPQISGFTFAYNPDNEPGDRVVSIAVNGVDVDMADTTAKYLLVTNDFMAAGGDDYTTLANFPVENEFGALDEMLRDYLLSNPDKSYAEAEGRITVVTGEYVAPPVAETAAEAEEAADETEPETKPAAAESVSGQTGVVANAAAVYVRTGHHPSYDVVTALTRGTVVQVHDLNSQWYQITCGDVEGWIYMGYIELR